MKPVPFIWAFRLKPLDAVGENFLEKARCCMRGDKQIAHEDFDSHTLYAPVDSHDSIRFLIAISAAEHAEIEGAVRRRRCAYHYGAAYGLFSASC